LDWIFGQSLAAL